MSWRYGEWTGMYGESMQNEGWGFGRVRKIEDE